MPIENQQRVAILLAAIAFGWLLFVPTYPLLASDATQADKPSNQRRRILLYYGNKLVDLRDVGGQRATEPGSECANAAGPAELKLLPAVPSPMDEHADATAAVTVLPPSTPVVRPPYYLERDAREGPIPNVLRQSAEYPSDPTERRAPIASQEAPFETPETGSGASFQQHGIETSLPASPDIAAAASSRLTSTQATIDVSAKDATAGVLPANIGWLEQRLTLLVLGLLGVVICLTFVVLYLLLASRKEAATLPATIRLEMPRFDLSGELQLPRPATDNPGPPSEHRHVRQGAAADLADQPVPTELFAGVYQQQRQQEQEQAKRQEEAILTEIFNENLLLRQDLQAQPV